MKTKLYQSTLKTELGILFLASTNKGLCILEFDNTTRIKHHLSFINKSVNYEIIEEDNHIICQAKIELKEYFSNERKQFNLPLDLYGTDFQLKVWNKLLDIPFGDTRSYKEQAIAIGDLKAIRAVATANGQNRVSIIIPCHRVIGSDGSLTGYGGELWRKKELLELESNQQKLF